MFKIVEVYPWWSWVLFAVVVAACVWAYRKRNKG